jgi:phage N-6-adenine-methyltransferase
MNQGMYTSKSDNWETPQWLFDELDCVFHFVTDVCATDDNKKCDRFFDEKIDGLKQHWVGNCWMNCPYGRAIGSWVKKAYDSKEACTVCLLPARTDTKWWQNYVMKADVIKFLKGRLKFGGGQNSAPFPSAIVIFNLFKQEVICANFLVLS